MELIDRTHKAYLSLNRKSQFKVFFSLISMGRHLVYTILALLLVTYVSFAHATSSNTAKNDDEEEGLFINTRNLKTGKEEKVDIRKFLIEEGGMNEKDLKAIEDMSRYMSILDMLETHKDDMDKEALDELYKLKNEFEGRMEGAIKQSKDYTRRVDAILAGRAQQNLQEQRKNDTASY